MENGKWKMQNAKSKMQHTAQSKRQNHKISGIQDPRSGIFHTPLFKKIKKSGHGRSGIEVDTKASLNLEYARTCVPLLSISTVGY